MGGRIPAWLRPLSIAGQRGGRIPAWPRPLSTAGQWGGRACLSAPHPTPAPLRASAARLRSLGPTSCRGSTPPIGPTPSVGGPSVPPLAPPPGAGRDPSPMTGHSWGGQLGVTPSAGSSSSLLPGWGTHRGIGAWPRPSQVYWQLVTERPVGHRAGGHARAPRRGAAPGPPTPTPGRPRGTFVFQPREGRRPGSSPRGVKALGRNKYGSGGWTQESGERWRKTNPARRDGGTRASGRLSSQLRVPVTWSRGEPGSGVVHGGVAVQAQGGQGPQAAVELRGRAGGQGLAQAAQPLLLVEGVGRLQRVGPGPGADPQAAPAWGGREGRGVKAGGCPATSQPQPLAPHPSQPLPS